MEGGCAGDDSVEGSVGQESRQRSRALNRRLQNLKDPEGA